MRENYTTQFQTTKTTLFLGFINTRKLRFWRGAKESVCVLLSNDLLTEWPPCKKHDALTWITRLEFKKQKGNTQFFSTVSNSIVSVDTVRCHKLCDERRLANAMSSDDGYTVSFDDSRCWRWAKSIGNCWWSLLLIHCCCRCCCCYWLWLLLSHRLLCPVFTATHIASWIVLGRRQTVAAWTTPTERITPIHHTWKI